MDWKIYYAGGTYSDEDGPPDHAPKRGVQAIVVRSELVGRRVERENDFYIWTPQNGGWRGVDQFGLYDYLIDPGSKIVLFGKMLSNNEYREIFNKAASDPDFPRKAGRMPEERRP